MSECYKTLHFALNEILSASCPALSMPRVIHALCRLPVAPLAQGSRRQRVTPVDLGGNATLCRRDRASWRNRLVFDAP
jgi:hypothetical protein